MSKIKNGGLDQYGPERFSRLILLYSQKNAGQKGLSAWPRETSKAGVKGLNVHGDGVPYPDNFTFSWKYLHFW